MKMHKPISYAFFCKFCVCRRKAFINNALEDYDISVQWKIQILSDTLFKGIKNYFFCQKTTVYYPSSG